MSEWVSLQSSNLASCRYNPDTRQLDIRFSSGRTYRYDGVPADVAEGLATASSAGKFFNSTIKNQFSTSQL